MGQPVHQEPCKIRQSFLVPDATMRHANLNLLPTLKALLETRSVSRAAEQLHLSQPSISKQLAQLRQ